MIDPAALVLWLVLGALTGWLIGGRLYGYRLADDLPAGGIGAILGGIVANALFRELPGGLLGVLALSLLLAVAVVVAVRIVPNHRILH